MGEFVVASSSLETVWTIGTWIVLGIGVLGIAAISRYPSEYQILKGMTQQEQRRARQLARRGEFIASSEDAELARSLVEALVSRETSWVGRAYRWVVVLTAAWVWLFPAVVAASRGYWWKASGSVVFFLLGIGLVMFYRRRLRRYQQTALANKWGRRRQEAIS